MKLYEGDFTENEADIDTPIEVGSRLICPNGAEYVLEEVDALHGIWKRVKDGRQD